MDPTTRRTVLKVTAAVPLAATFGLLLSPLLRFMRPTLKPLDVVGPSDQPVAEQPVPSFTDKDFPEDWTCLPFSFRQSYVEYNPEGKETREIPGFIVKIPGGDIVAYSRICPHLGCIFNFVPEPADCAKGYNFDPRTLTTDGKGRPVFACPCHLSVYDILNGGKVVSGPAPRPPRKFEVKKMEIRSKSHHWRPGELPSNTASSGFSQAMSGVWDWCKTRINNIDIFDEHYQHEMKTNPFYALGPIFYLVWFIVMATGCVLIIWYVPTKASAFDSIFDIQWKIPFGGLIRGMHKYGADAMIIAATMRMYRIFLMGDYKPGKEFNVLIGLLALLLSMYSGLTGYLLIWNQRAFWATKVFATFPTYMDQFPVMGDFYQPLIKSFHLGWNTAEILLGGGAAITQETITRFFSLHLAFSLIPLILVELYFYKNAYRRVPLNWTKRMVVTMMLVVVAMILPAAQGRRSNPDVTPLPILSDWYFLGLYQMYKYLEPVVATEITILIPLSVILLPFLDVALTGPEKDIMKRPLMLMVSFMAIATWVIFSYLIIVNIANIHSDPPYWRLFFYGTIDVGILWQLALIWINPDVIQRAKAAKTAFILGIMGAVQSFLGITFYYMAQTEIFMDPMWHQFLYRFVRVALGDSANQLEAAIKQIIVPMSSTLAYNQDFIPMCRETFTKVPTAAQGLKTLTDLSAQSTPVDILFTWIPSFTSQPYKGAIDFLIVNRWAYDYVNFGERMIPGHVSGSSGQYPLAVPELDMVWIVISFVVMGAGFGTWFWCKKQSGASQPTPVGAQQQASA